MFGVLVCIINKKEFLIDDKKFETHQISPMYESLDNLTARDVYRTRVENQKDKRKNNKAKLSI